LRAKVTFLFEIWKKYHNFAHKNNKIMKNFAILIIAILLSLSLWAQSPKHEVRAVWLTTIGGVDWPHSHYSQSQKEELRKTLDLLKEAGINTVLLQTRIRATTIFPSSMEPWDGCITGEPGYAPSYDPLKFAIDECHIRGMELHAWVVTIPIGKWNKYGCTKLRAKYPKLVRKLGEEGYMNPELPATASYLADFCREIVRQYDVDGIHLDYIRYPETWPKAKNFAERATRRNHITNIVKAINKAVKEEKPWVKMSCSPIGKHADLLRYRSGGWNARNAVSQDAQLWMREGLMDELFPMMYFRDNQFFPFAIDWQEQAAGRIIAPGLGIYFLDPREGKWTLRDVSRQMHVSRQLGLGHCYFRSKFLTDNVKGIYLFAKHFNQTPALVPPMKWLEKTPPTPPQRLRHNGQVLSWSEAENRNDSPYLLYNIYASKTYPVDINNAENLVATKVKNTNINVPKDKRIFYAVTAYDRYGLESEACQMPKPTNDDFFWLTDDVQQTDGKWLRLPIKPVTLDANILIVETLLGQQVTVLPFEGKYANISKLPDGIYVMRSLGRKSRNHRLGYFSIKRTK
jgi:uncharacterized lipoprotein YddW (UPF0748 family)